MKYQCINNSEVVIKGQPVTVKFIHPDIIAFMKMQHWDGGTIYSNYDELYFTHLAGKVVKCVEKIYYD